MGWKVVTLTREDVRLRRVEQLTDQFRKLVTEAHFPKDAGVYAPTWAQTRAPGWNRKLYPHYFPPEAAAIAAELLAEWHAEDCVPQDRTLLSRLVEVEPIHN